MSDSMMSNKQLAEGAVHASHVLDRSYRGRREDEARRKEAAEISAHYLKELKDAWHALSQSQEPPSFSQKAPESSLFFSIEEVKVPMVDEPEGLRPRALTSFVDQTTSKFGSVEYARSLSEWFAAATPNVYLDR